MPRIVGTYEAKNHPLRLLKQVEAGETVTITRHGREIAPIEPAGKTLDVVAQILDLRKTVTPPAKGENLSMRNLIGEGRR